LISKIEAEIILGDNLGSPKWHPRQIANEKSSSCQAIFGAIALHYWSADAAKAAMMC